MRPHCLGLPCVLALAGIASAQQLIRDLDPAPTRTFPTLVRQLLGDGQRVFFTASNDEAGEALYVTDGTAAGTRLYKDLPVGAASSLPHPLGLLGGELVFTSGVETWITSSAPGGVTFLSDRVVDSVAGIRVIGQVGSRFLFAERGQIGNTHLWSTDGTAAGTVQLGSHYVNHSIVAGGLAWFSAAYSTFGYEPWVSDGTVAGTRLIADLVPAGSSAPTAFATLGGVVHFLAAQPNGDVALWRTDGSAAGTAMIRGFAGVQLHGANSEMIEVQGRLLFPLGPELWSSDGTTAGTQRLQAGLSAIGDLHTAAGLGFFTATTPATGQELYVSDGTAAGTHLLLDLTPGASGTLFASFATAAGRLFTRVSAAGAQRLVSTDGTAAGTTAIATPALGLAGPLAELAAVGTAVVLNYPQGLMVSDGTVAGTSVLLTPGSYRPGTFASPGVALGDQLLFFADDGSSGRELWHSDGTAAGTAMVVDLFAGAGSGIQADAEIVAMDGLVYFTTGTVTASNQPFRPRLLYRTDGTAAGTVALTQYTAANLGGGAASLQVHDHALYFVDTTAAGLRLFRTDGSSVQQVPQVAGLSGGRYRVVGGLIYYFTESYSLWRSDGTPGGTFRLASQAYDILGAFGGNLVFVDGGAIKLSDGTLAGTRVLSAASTPWQVTGIGQVGAGFFWVQRQLIASPYDYELMRTDGTPSGTASLAVFHYLPQQFTIAGDTLYMLAFDAASGTELWRSDGTVAGTQQVIDLAPGRESGVQQLAAIGAGNRLFLAASEGITGLEPWISDGTATGTAQLIDGNPDGSGNPQYLGSAGSRLFFLLDDGVHGTEPWQVPLAVIGAAAAQSIGRGCAGSAGVPELAALGHRASAPPSSASSCGACPPSAPPCSCSAPTGRRRCCRRVAGCGPRACCCRCSRRRRSTARPHCRCRSRRCRR